MLKRLYIDNFRSFVNFEYRPKAKQLLIGSNGSGKSSLLDAIRYLKVFMYGVENPFLESTRTRWLNLPKQVFEVEASIDGRTFLYRVENHFRADSPVSEVRLERLLVAGATVFEQIDGTIHFFVDSPNAPSALPWKTTRSALNLARLSNVDVDKFLTWIQERVFCFRLDAYRDAMSDTAEGEDVLPEDEVENLAAWYRHLVQADPEANVALLHSLAQTLEGFVSLQFDSVASSTRILRVNFINTHGGKKRTTYSLEELSDGQRCLMALYSILHFVIAKQENTVFIDEPDNFVSLREIQPWLQLAEEAVEDHKGQLVLISHHPEVLNYWAQEYGLLFEREENGQVRTKPFSAVPDAGLGPAETVARGWERSR